MYLLRYYKPDYNKAGYSQADYWKLVITKLLKLFSRLMAFLDFQSPPNTQTVQKVQHDFVPTNLIVFKADWK
jgi:hypothetical protein